MTRMTLIAALLTGCASITTPCPALDAGPAIEADATPGIVPGTIGALWACGDLDRIVREAEREGVYGPCEPAPTCPWPAVVTPRHPEARCSPEGVEACLGAVDGANNCTTLAEAIASCDPEACR